MKILQVYGYREASKKLGEGADIVVFNEGPVHAFLYYGGYGSGVAHPMRCHVMTFSGELASKITDKFGWGEVNYQRSQGFITLLAREKSTKEVISTLEALAV